MRLFGFSILLIIVFAASLFAQSETRRLAKDATGVRVTDLQIEGQNINKLLAKIAYMYDVPISLEVATNEDLLKARA